MMWTTRTILKWRALNVLGYLLVVAALCYVRFVWWSHAEISTPTLLRYAGAAGTLMGFSAWTDWWLRMRIRPEQRGFEVMPHEKR